MWIGNSFRKARHLCNLGKTVFIFITETQHSVSYVVYKERAHNKSSSRTDLFRKRSTSFGVGLPRTVCRFVCVLNVLVFKIPMLVPSDESFVKSLINLSTTCYQCTPHACAAAQLRFVTERKKKTGMSSK